MTTTFRSAADDAVELRDAARAVSQRAYVPYSKFRVGAALRFADGSVVTGCNVENASFGLTVCAERNALTTAVAAGHDPATIDLIAVHVDSSDGQPCGMCRQFIAELAPNARIAFAHAGSYVECVVPELLPGAFVPEALDA